MEKPTKESGKKIIFAVCSLLVSLSIFLLVYKNWAPKTTEGDKTIRVDIHFADGTRKPISIQTNAEYLRQALEEQELIGGDDGEFGFMIKTVDGVTADDTRQEWWCVTKGGEQLFTGVDSTPIADGDRYEITLTVGW